MAKRHPITRYCSEHKITRAELARRSGLSPQFLNDVVKGRRQLGRISAYQLLSATDGALTLDTLLVPGEAA